MALRPGANTTGKIDWSRTSYQYLVEYPLLSTLTTFQQGSCMIATSETGVSEQVLNVSDGGANSRFVGCVSSDYFRMTDFINIENCTIPNVAAYTFTLGKGSPTGGTFYVEDTTVPGTAWTDASPGAPAATTQYSVSSNVVTFHASDANKNVDIRYTYTPTTVEMTSRFHERPVNAQGQSLIQQAPVMQGICTVYTTMYVTSGTYTVGCRVYQAASGKFTASNTGVQVCGMVVSIPSTSDPYLGVTYNVTPGALTW